LIGGFQILDDYSKSSYILSDVLVLLYLYSAIFCESWNNLVKICEYDSPPLPSPRPSRGTAFIGTALRMKVEFMAKLVHEPKAALDDGL